MFSLLCVSSLFAISALAQNTMPLGGGIQVDLDKDSPVCDIQVVVPPQRALGGCKILIDTYYPASSVRPTLEFYWNRGAASTDAAAKLTPIEGSDGEQAWASCSSAGTYHLGVRIAECTACIAGKNGVAVVTTAWQFDDKVRVDLVDKMRSAWITINETEQVVYEFSTTTAGTAHFDVDKTTTSKADDLRYSWKAKAASNWTVVDSSNLLNLVQFDVPAAGDYEFSIALIDAPHPKTTTEFQVDYQFNSAPELSWPEAVCPQEDCAALASCTLCAENDCTWCSSTKKCGASCADDESNAITDDDKCPDVDAECDKNEDCVSCADAPGCVWCDTGGAIASALSTGSCSAGKDDLGKECKGLASAVTDAMQCDGASHNSPLVAAMLVVLATLLIGQ